LFDKLQLKPSKKTKTGYSTDESVLQKLAHDHEIVPKILRYRQIQKLNSTYIEPFIKLSLKDKNNKIYTSFVHTGTATGRLSSKNPNLQNIPTRTQEGQCIKKAFEAKSGCVLVGLDYSQIELRLLAHFSKDPALLEAFEHGEDIHLQTAIKIFGTDKAKANRHIAKTINFGLIYGMGSSKLAQTLAITTKEAKLYIEKYFESFNTVKSYLDSIKQYTKEHGYVQTIVGRRRYFDIKDAKPFEEANYLREAVNTVFQGTAADIIKLAMIKIHNKYIDTNDTKMLLQIHDELIFEVDEAVASTRANEIKDIMENIYDITVPLVCSVSIGKNWSELK
jgi:DNA polymerase-1